jgi:hypothetical protein
MSQKDVVQIRVSGQTVGIIGIKDVLAEVAGCCGRMSDKEVQAELLKRLSKSNYIPDRATTSYAEAFLREFKKAIGAPYEEERLNGLDVKVLGPGCPNCDRLEQEVMAAMADLNLQGNVEHIRDIKEIGKYGVMGSPALLINGKVKAVGKVPPRAQLKKWLKCT